MEVINFFNYKMVIVISITLLLLTFMIVLLRTSVE